MVQPRFDDVQPIAMSKLKVPTPDFGFTTGHAASPQTLSGSKADIISRMAARPLLARSGNPSPSLHS